MENHMSYRRTPERSRRISDKALIWAFIVLAITFGLTSLLDQFSDGDIPGVVHFEQAAGASDGSIRLPPAVGKYANTWQECGVYQEPLSSEYALHSLAHGAVWIAYRPDLADADVDYLEETLAQETYVLLSPFPSLSSPVVVTAWGVQLELSSVTDVRLEQFITRYRLNTDAPEAGASCEGGVGSPLR